MVVSRKRGWGRRTGGKGLPATLHSENDDCRQDDSGLPTVLPANLSCHRGLEYATADASVTLRIGGRVSLQVAHPQLKCKSCLSNVTRLRQTLVIRAATVRERRLGLQLPDGRGLN